MADTTKLASTFPAWRLTIGVRPEFLEAALDCCEGLGLEPKVCGFQGKGDVGVLFSVFVPRCVCKNPESDFIRPHMAPFHGALVHGVEAKLICPVAEPEQPAKPKFKVWKTIKIGTGLKTVDDFVREFRGQNMKIGDWATDMLRQKTFGAALDQQELDLVVVSAADLGFNEAARRDMIYERALEVGLQLCPAEVGPQLRLQYGDQPNGEWILIGMEPIRDSGGGLRVFRVARGDSELWLHSDYGYPDFVWPPGYQWVFIRPRK